MRPPRTKIASGSPRSRSSKPTRRSASSLSTRSPKSIVCTSTWGSCSTRSTVAPFRWKISRKALRAPGERARTPASTASRIAKPRASCRSRAAGAARRSSARSNCGVSGQAISSRSAVRRSSSSDTAGLQLRAQPPEGTRGARLDRAAPEREHLRGLLLAEVEQVAAREHRAVVLAQALERGEKLGARLGGDCPPLGRRSRVPRGKLMGGAERQALASSLGAAAVARLVRDDREQPGAEGRAAAEARQRPPRLRQPDLGGVLGLGGVTGDEKCSAEGDLLVVADERGESGGVATTCALDELVLCR